MYAGITSGALPIAQRTIGTFNQQIKYIPFPSNNRAPNTLAYMDWFPPQNWNPPQFVFPTLYFVTEFPSVAGQVINFQMTGLGRGQGQALGGDTTTALSAFQQGITGVDQLQIDVATGSGSIRTGSRGDWVQFKLRRRGDSGNLLGEIQVIGIKIRYFINKGTSEGLL